MTLHHPVVDTAYGPVRGIDDGTAMSWKGVRYAAPPVGELRFRAPQAPQPWTEVLDADTYGFVCPQPPVPNFPLDLGAAANEDCLFLNIWAPSGTKPGDDKPVMVWLHGGAYVLGSSSQPLYNGKRLAASGDVIVVTLNYRIGVFGFLDLSQVGGRRHFDSNIGLRDVLAALHWVRQNIGGFGGDPDRVTLFGESAGAGIVTTLLAVPEAGGLFAGAISQSSPTTSVYSSDRAQRVTHRVLGHLGIAPADAHRMAEVDVPALISATKRVFDEVPVRNPGMLAFVPIVDGDLLHDYPVNVARTGKTHPVPLVIGTNLNEAALFRLMRSPLLPITPKAITSMFNDIAAEQPDLQLPNEEQLGLTYRGKKRGLSIASDVGFRMPSVWLAEGHCQVAPVYLYRFDYATPIMKMLLVGAAHATELPYVWGTLGAPRDVTLKLGGVKTAKAVSKRVRTRWVNFAATAKPAGPLGEPEWLPYQDADRACLIIDRTDRLISDSDAHIRAAWGSDVVHFR
ncbi:carboxylesterase/lipase family protein [Mycolicibacterium sp.]|uniref:carboxylesterase/lipase family protein n=1 Tax=Mycolicibacterium sp. TaxID=2320850 RepID=UPI0028AF5B74|nr:carboxylesterase/lipase family protein [Mycolicibacterium sp.]